MNMHCFAPCRDDLLLVNPSHPYCPLSPPDLIPVGGSQVLLERRAALPLEALMAQLGGWGKITPVSGWRSGQEQRAIWDQSILDHGLPFTQTYVARPGCSEHQTGLAIDLGWGDPETLDFLRPAFPYIGLCLTFRRLAPQYGFVERYPAGKEAITGIGHEPWHFRYVGTPHAQRMTQAGLTLEEYLPLLQEGRFDHDPDPHLRRTGRR